MSELIKFKTESIEAELEALIKAMWLLSEAGKKYFNGLELLNVEFSADEIEYLQFHKRLPGGNSNARLLKKRKTKVTAWCNRRHK